MAYTQRLGRAALDLALGAAIAAVFGNAGWSETEPRAPLEIVEWAVPWPGTRPRDPYVEGADAVWFVGQKGDYIARFDPGDVSFTKVDLDPGTGPHNLVVDASGSVWFAGNRKGHIGRYDPVSGEIATFAMPDAAARDPHTLIFGGDGKLWFTVQGGNFVGRLDPAAQSIDLVAVPTRRARPYGIAIAPDGTPWVALFGTAKLASIDPRTLSLREHPLPRAEARPRRIGVTSDGRVWYVDHRAGFLGALDPATGAIAEWRMPAGRRARPYAMAIDDRDRIWIVETGPRPNTLVGFDPATERFFSITPIPSGAGSVRHMVYDPPGGSLWFGTDAGTIGRAQID